MEVYWQFLSRYLSGPLNKTFPSFDALTIVVQYGTKVGRHATCVTKWMKITRSNI